MTQKPLLRAKVGLNKTDKRILHTKLLYLKKVLTDHINFILNSSLRKRTKTHNDAIERQFRIKLTAVDILITHLNYEKNETCITSFRKSANVAKGAICKTENVKGISPGVRLTVERKRDDRLPVRRPQTEYRYNYVSSYGSAKNPPG